MTEKKTGGPAFPSEGEGHGNPKYHSPGMTLRDWFAGRVLEGMLAHATRYKPHLGDSHNWRAAISEEAYQMADAMLAEREK